jgi:hypothetical protein
MKGQRSAPGKISFQHALSTGTRSYASIRRGSRGHAIAQKRPPAASGRISGAARGRREPCIFAEQRDRRLWEKLIHISYAVLIFRALFVQLFYQHLQQRNCSVFPVIFPSEQYDLPVAVRESKAVLVRQVPADLLGPFKRIERWSCSVRKWVPGSQAIAA